jgi:hypothetical protein
MCRRCTQRSPPLVLPKNCFRLEASGSNILVTMLSIQGVQYVTILELVSIAYLAFTFTLTLPHRWFVGLLRMPAVATIVAISAMSTRPASTSRVDKSHPRALTVQTAPSWPRQLCFRGQSIHTFCLSGGAMRSLLAGAYHCSHLTI